MSTDYLPALSILFRNGPYFLGATHGRQASILQHLVMTGVVSTVAKVKPFLRIVEIGSWIGFSALTWAFAVNKFGRDGGEVICIDTWEPYFKSVDLQKETTIYADMDQMSRLGLSYDLFRHNVSFAPQRAPIRHIRKPSAQALETIAPNSVDIVYLDGSHYYDDVKADIQKAIPLLTEHGVLCGDDLELQLPDVDMADVRAALAEDYVQDRRTGRPYHPGVALAVHETVGRVPAIDGFWFTRRSGAGWEHFDPLAGEVVVPAHFTPDMRRKAEEIIKKA